MGAERPRGRDEMGCGGKRKGGQKKKERPVPVSSAGIEARRGEITWEEKNDLLGTKHGLPRRWAAFDKELPSRVPARSGIEG